MARCPRNRNSKILERADMQIPPSAPAKLPAKLPQQPLQDQDDLEHDRPSNLSARVGQLCAWLLEHPPSQLGRQLRTLALDFVRFLQRSRALRLQATRYPALSDRLFWLPPNHSCLGSRRETLEPTVPRVVHPCFGCSSSLAGRAHQLRYPDPGANLNGKVCGADGGICMSALHVSLATRRRRRSLS